MPGSDLSLLIDAAQEAGRIACGFAGKNPEVWDKADGAGPVTEADLAVNRMLDAELRAARPDYGWLSEESPQDDARLNDERVFIIDPIDGTRSFIAGDSTWAHSLAIAEKGKVTAAVVYLPLRDKLYTAELGHGAHLNGDVIAVGSRPDLIGADILATKPAMDAKNWHALPDVKRNHRPSLAYRLSLVAEGKFDAMFTFRPTWEWDVAAGDLILQEAGAITSDRHGAPLIFNNKDPRLAGMIGANATLHQSISDALVY